MAQKRIFAGLILLLLALGVSAQEKGVGFDDALITERVTSAIRNDPMLGKTDISIETRDGVVHLKGFVRSMAEVHRAGALARGITGVTAVRNTIRVADRPSRARASGHTRA